MKQVSLFSSILALFVTLLSGCGDPTVGSQSTASRRLGRSTDGVSGTKMASTIPVDIQLDQPTSGNPFIAGMAAVPETLRPGDSAVVVVRAIVADRWHVYASDKPTGVGIPTKLQLKLPEGVEAVGAWRRPEPELYPAYDDPCYVYQGDLEFRHELKIADNAPAGTVMVGCHVTYQTCNESTCMAPAKAHLSARVAIMAD